ncbi:4-coumarate--CoA ligase [Elysia marginata]|uniref:4-coumarate--CoA ligase n=1 Tax=Elysia marginata TaxID=1093978 RepID=A0AAV4JL54_9GAST|nr:4-coumarate--CoA ligase [Elysia marginata]
MASRRLKQHLCGRLHWQLKATGKTDNACAYPYNSVFAWPSQSLQQVSAHLHTGPYPVRHVPRLLSALGLHNARLGHGSRASRPGCLAAASGQTRHVTMVSKSESQHDPVSADNVLRNPVPDIHIPPQLSLHQMIFDICDKYKDRLAVEDYLNGRHYTYSQLKEAIARVASALYRKGYRKGDVLCAFAVNNVDYTVLSVACAAAGVWFSAANPGFTAEEFARQLHHCEARGVCVSAPLAQVAKDALANQEFPNKVKMVVYGGIRTMNAGVINNSAILCHKHPTLQWTGGIGNDVRGETRVTSLF